LLGFFGSSILLLWLLVALGASKGLCITLCMTYVVAPPLIWLIVRGQATTWKRPPLAPGPMFLLSAILIALTVVTAASNRSGDFSWVGLLFAAAVFASIGIALNRNVRAYGRWQYGQGAQSEHRRPGRSTKKGHHR
jgi:hypothetical protein